MKSPWKFLAQLTSRRRPAETGEGSIGHDADPEAGESQAQQTPALPLNPTEASGGSGHDENRSVEPLATTTSNEAEGDDAPVVSAPARPKRRGRAKGIRIDKVALSPATANKDRDAQSSPSREAFFDEVAGLDEEIRQLRIQLAQKLHLQNVQLKKMLERFDVS